MKCSQCIAGEGGWDAGAFIGLAAAVVAVVPLAAGLRRARPGRTA